MGALLAVSPAVATATTFDFGYDQTYPMNGYSQLQCGALNGAYCPTGISGNSSPYNVPATCPDTTQCRLYQTAAPANRNPGYVPPGPVLRFQVAPGDNAINPGSTTQFRTQLSISKDVNNSPTYFDSASGDRWWSWAEYIPDDNASPPFKNPVCPNDHGGAMIFQLHEDDNSLKAGCSAGGGPVFGVSIGQVDQIQSGTACYLGFEHGASHKFSLWVKQSEDPNAVSSGGPCIDTNGENAVYGTNYPLCNVYRAWPDYGTPAAVTPIARDQWHRFMLHVFFSRDPNQGLLELWVDGVQVYSKHIRTVLTYVSGCQYAGQDVKVFLTQGLYGLGSSATSILDAVYAAKMLSGISRADVEPGTPGLQLSAAPASVTTRNGGGAVTSTISVTATNGLTGTVNLSASGASSLASVTLSPATLTFTGSGTKTSTLTMSAGTAPNGTYTININATTSGANTSPPPTAQTAISWTIGSSTQPQPRLVIQPGTSANEYGYANATDANGNIFVAGYTEGNLYGTNAGGKDAFVAKYDSSGNLIWGTQLGGAGDEHAYGLALAGDGSGSVYIVGSTTASFGGLTFRGGTYDAFVAKYSSSGALLWKNIVGTSGDDIAYAVTSGPSGDVYAAGYTTGGLYYTGQGGMDAWAARYSASSGGYVWGRDVGAPGDEVFYGIALDSVRGNVFVVGSTTDSVGDSYVGGAHDVLLALYDANTGARNGLHNVGSTGDDIANAVAVDSSGNAVIAGGTTGSYGGTNQGGSDAFIAVYGPTGALVRSTLIGGPADEVAYGVALDTSGNIYAAGGTTGVLGTTNYGGYDVFLRVYSGTLGLLNSLQTGTGGDELARGVSTGGGYSTSFNDDFNITGSLGSNWMTYGTWSTNGTAAMGTGGTSDYAFWTGSPSANAIARVRIAIPLASTYIGVMTRGNPAAPVSDHYAAYIGPEGNVHIARRNAYVYTYLADGGAYPSGAHTLSITATGSNPVVLSLKIDGIEVLSASDSSTSALTGAGQVGMFDYNGAGQPIDQFTVIEPGAGVNLVGGTTGAMTGTNAGGKDVFIISY